MHILVISNLYPPVAFGGYEVECATVAERLAERHEVSVLTSVTARRTSKEQAVRRDLALLSPDWRGALRAPSASVRAVSVVRRALRERRPDFIYVWNAARLPQAALRAIADSEAPLGVRVCEHWFGRLFTGDQYLRELLPGRRSPARCAWSLGCRVLNRSPGMRLQPLRPFRAAISWNSEAIRRMVRTPPFVTPVLEQVCWSVPRHGSVFAAAEREPAPEVEIAFVGRVTEVKGVSVAIEALAELRKDRGLPASLVVAGAEDGDYGNEMRGLARKLGVSEAITWRGPTSPEDLAGVLARAHVLIVPSLWDEPFPLVTIEGAFARVPLVAADVGGIGEGMRDQEHALLFPRGDAHAAADAIARTLLEAEATAARVARARAHAERFRLAPYLAAQEAFVEQAYAACKARR